MTPRLPSGIIPIIVDLRKSTEGLVSVDSKVVGKNRLLQNYFRLLYAVMARKEYTMRDNSGTWATIDYDGDFVYNIGRLCKCDDTTELSYDSYTCANRTDYTPDSVGTGVEGDESYLEVIKTFGADVPSVALKFNLRTTGGGGLGAVIGHKVVNASASQAVSYRLKFKEPWLRNFAEFLKGVMQDADVGGLVDINGASFTLRIKGTTLADSAKVLIGYGNNPFSPSDTSLTNPKELDSYVIG
ncbi:MAG: hypothetical protein J7J22_04665, partial [Candidatus Verstraetearchaeota archaeon]|nr:hypothetical protein [Candidatus Verstraetearchaeota archaeon]